MASPATRSITGAITSASKLTPVQRQIALAATAQALTLGTYGAANKDKKIPDILKFTIPASLISSIPILMMRSKGFSVPAYALGMAAMAGLSGTAMPILGKYTGSTVTDVKNEIKELKEHF